MKQLLGDDLPRIAWYDAEPGRLAVELAAMHAIAADLEWRHGATSGAGEWAGPLPLWPFARPMPAGLDRAISERFRVVITLDEAHPATEPSIHPVQPTPSVHHRLAHRWHVRGDGSLCLLQVPADWTGREPVADLAVKAAGWYLEYLLLEAGIVSTMTLGGIAVSPKYDAFLTRLIKQAA